MSTPQGSIPPRADANLVSALRTCDPIIPFTYQPHRNLSGSLVITSLVPYRIGQYADLFPAEIQNGAHIGQVLGKVIRGVPHDNGARDQLRRRIWNAVSDWSRLEHRNLVPLLGVDYTIPHLMTLVMPLYERGNVIQYLETSGNADRLCIIRGVANGLEYLHSRSVTHTDIRGSNVLVDDEGNPRLTDVGLSTALDSPMFTTAQPMGPVRWQAPEVIEYNEDQGGLSAFTRETDVYSFAMLVIEILTLEKPFNHRKLDTTVIFDVIKGLRPNKPPEEPLVHKLWPLIQRCWSQDPRERPTMSEISRTS